MTEFLRGTVLLAQAKRPTKRGRTLREFRFEAHAAAALRRKGNHRQADRFLEVAEKNVFRDLLRRRRMSAVMRHSKLINRILTKVAQQEERDSDRNN